MSRETVLSYGGGRQTVAICVLIARGVLPKPDRIVMADTGRENPMTWEYLDAHVRPMLATLRLGVERVRSRIPPLTYGVQNTPLIPVYTPDGKLNGYCSGQWKRDRITQYLASKGVTGGQKWIGFSLEERRRVQRMAASDRQPNWEHRFPLVELMLTSGDCLELIRSAGLPEPHRSSCWMCPHKGNAEWRHIRDNHPAEWAQACEIDRELREEDIERGNSGVWLHKSRVPLAEANLDEPETAEIVRQCGLGMCFV